MIHGWFFPKNFKTIAFQISLPGGKYYHEEIHIKTMRIRILKFPNTETPRLTLIPQSNAVLESYRNTYHITVTSQSAILPNTFFPGPVMRVRQGVSVTLYS